MKIRKLNLILTTLLFPGLVLAEQVIPFASVWKEIQEHSPALQASSLQQKSAAAAATRGARHWLPHLYLDAKSYQTNDSGAAFIGLLEQRSLQQTDFSPDSINHPDTRIYNQGTLGIDLPIYEGGLRSGQSEVLEYSSRAESNHYSQMQIEQYAQVSRSYALLLILSEQKAKTQTLQNKLQALSKNYTLGSKANPMGYTGLLGLKTLANKLIAQQKQIEAKMKTEYSRLREMGLSQSDWIPTSQTLSQFVEQTLSTESSGAASASYSIEAHRQNTKAASKAAEMQRAQFLPKIGAFAESTIFNSTRATANNTMMGLYLKWDLFNPQSYGSLNEAQLKALASEKMLEATEKTETANRESLIEGIKVAKETLALLTESEALTHEQTQSTESLFKNGSINILQFLEVLNRKSDLITQISEAETGLVMTSSQLATQQKFDTALNNSRTTP